MAKFDMDSTYDGSFHITYDELYFEIMDEMEDRASKKDSSGAFIDKNAIQKKFKNKDGSGLRQKLRDKLHFDIDAIHQNDPSEKYNALKLLKLLYYIEKDGKSKNKGYRKQETRIKIIDILTKPNLENVPTRFSKKSEYGEIFDEILTTLEKQIPDAKARYDIIWGIEREWEYTSQEFFKYVYTDGALADQEQTVKELDRVDGILKNILNSLDIIDPFQHTGHEGVLQTFYNLLICHRYLCRDADRLMHQPSFPESPSEAYISKLKSYESCAFRWEVLEFFYDYIRVYWPDDFKTRCTQKKPPEQFKETDEFVRLLFSLVFQSEDEKGWDIQQFLLAGKYVKVLVDWLAQVKGDVVNYEKEIAVDMLVIIMQEIISTVNSRERFKNNYYGYTYSQKPVLAALKNPDQADAALVQFWINKLENRTAVLYGGQRLLLKKREIERKIYRIKQFIYSYRDISEIQFVNHHIFHHVGLSLISEEIAKKGLRSFCKTLSDKLQDILKPNNILIPDDTPGILDIIREFIWNENVKHILVLKITDIIKARMPNLKETESMMIELHFPINSLQLMKRTFSLSFSVDVKDHFLLFHRIDEIYSPQDRERLRSLGLPNLF